MPDIFIVMIFSQHEYFLIIVNCCYGNMHIEINITNWSVNETNIKITGIFNKTNLTCTPISMPHNFRIRK